MGGGPSGGHGPGGRARGGLQPPIPLFSFSLLLLQGGAGPPGPAFLLAPNQFFLLWGPASAPGATATTAAAAATIHRSHWPGKATWLLGLTCWVHSSTFPTWDSSSTWKLKGSWILTPIMTLLCSKSFHSSLPPRTTAQLLSQRSRPFLLFPADLLSLISITPHSLTLNHPLILKCSLSTCSVPRPVAGAEKTEVDSADEPQPQRINTTPTGKSSVQEASAAGNMRQDRALVAGEGFPWEEKTGQNRW